MVEDPSLPPSIPPSAAGGSGSTLRATASTDNSETAEDNNGWGGDSSSAPSAAAAAFLEATAPGGDRSDADLRTRSSSSEPILTTQIVSTCNQMEDEPWLPVRSIVTMFRINVRCGDKEWSQLRRYTDFHDLDAALAKTFDPVLLPPLPPKLLVNEDAAIATRFLELDAYLRGLLANGSIRHHAKLHEFLGIEKHGARYGMRRYEYDSAQSEGNRYIRDNDL